MLDTLDITAARKKEECYCVVIKPFTLVVETVYWDIG